MEEGKTGINLKKVEEKLLYYLIDNKISIISPKTHYNKIEYTSLKEFDGYKDNEQLEEILDNLSNKGYLEKNEHDRLIHCPKCDSIDNKLKYNCPQCGSIRVRKYELMEHMECGFVGERADFKQTKKNVICPKCHLLIPSNSSIIEIIGVSSICENCGYKFDKPDTTNHCQNCGTIFDHTNSIYKKLYTNRTTKKITELLPVREIRETLRKIESIFLENNYIVELEGQLNGKSNKEHVLSIIAQKLDNIVILDISPWGKDENYTNLLGKKMDINPQVAIMVDLSEAEALNPMEEIYNIKLFNGKDPEFTAKFREYLLELEPQEEKPKGFLGSMFNKNNGS